MSCRTNCSAIVTLLGVDPRERGRYHATRRLQETEPIDPYGVINAWKGISQRSDYPLRRPNLGRKLMTLSRPVTPDRIVLISD